MKELYEIYRGCNYKVSTDSRSIEGGELFFALKGENFDGNAYAMQALEKGAARAVVDKDASLPQDERLIRVDDPFRTMQELAVWHRNHVLEGRHLPVIGLTGTNGKTTTKELITAVLSKKLSVTATKGNLNNDIGVPLTLLSITPDTRIAVVEMGANHPDDIARLVQVCQPDYGLITNVGRAHLLGFGSFEGVKAAKGELYKYLSSRPGSVVFLNNDDENLRSMARDWVTSHIWPYGQRYDGVRILPSSPAHPFLRLKFRDGEVLETSLIGDYNASNIMAALAIGRYFGVPREDAFDAIREYKPVNKRSQLLKTERNTLVVDAYNANPSSMAVALNSFAALKAEKKLALLGDMRELGEASLSEHLAVLRLLDDAGLDACLVGEEFRKACEEFGPNSWKCYSTSEQLAEALAAMNLSGYTLLVKGSRGIQMEKVIPSL